MLYKSRYAVRTICNEFVQVLCDFFAHDIWPSTPVHWIAQHRKNDLLGQRRQRLQRRLSKIAIGHLYQTQHVKFVPVLQGI